MICRNIDKDYDISCQTFSKKFVQRVVLINKKDVSLYQIYSTNSQNRILFKLKAAKRGFGFLYNEQGYQVTASFAKSMNGTMPNYSHQVNIIVMGNNEEAMTQFNQLDNSDYFAALLTYSGDVVIYGFKYGLSTENYNYDPANVSGGAIIKLASKENALEDEPPLIYKSQSGNEITDFDNGFEDTIFEFLGDFNNDFNIDFDNE